MLQVGKLGPKRPRDLPGVMNQLQGFFLCSVPSPWASLLSRPLPWHGPAWTREQACQTSPVAVPWAFRVETARCPDIYFLPGCRVLRATVSSQALPFHSEPGFLFAPSVGSKLSSVSNWGVLFLLESPAQTALVVGSSQGQPPSLRVCGRKTWLPQTLGY